MGHEGLNVCIDMSAIFRSTVPLKMGMMGLVYPTVNGKHHAALQNTGKTQAFAVFKFDGLLSSGGLSVGDILGSKVEEVMTNHLEPPVILAQAQVHRHIVSQKIPIFSYILLANTKKSCEVPSPWNAR